MNEQTLCISPSSLKGTITIPSSKSHSMRALLFAMMGHGKSHITHLLPSRDTLLMLRAIQLFGAKVHTLPSGLEITGGFRSPPEMIQAGQSGLILRLIGALAGLLPSTTTLKGDQLRPITPLLQALQQLGAFTMQCDQHITISGPLSPGKAVLCGSDSQPVSGLLISCSFLESPSEIFVSEPSEQPWIDLTLHWLQTLGAKVQHDQYTHYWIEGGLSYEGFDYSVPGDFSSAAFALVAALVTRSTLTLGGLDFTDIQGDKILLDWLQEMGACISLDQVNKQLTIQGDREIRGARLDLNHCIDALPILAVLGCFAKGETHLIGAAGSRFKESNRIHAICKELQKMGARIEELPDGLLVKPSPLKGAQLSSHFDHRIAMSLAVAALGAQGISTIFGCECIEKTYPTFIQDFQQIRASYRIL